MSARPLLNVDNVSVETRDGRSLVRSLSLSVAPGDCLLIQGPNGSGKTSVLRTILGLQKPVRGKIEFALGFENLGYLPQIGNVRFFLPLRLTDVIHLETVGAKQEKDILALGLLDEAALHHNWNTASGGERQRTLLTRALIQRPRLLILDEPFNHLDTATRRRVSELLRRYLAGELLNNEKGALILISHETALEGLTPTRVVNLAELPA